MRPMASNDVKHWSGQEPVSDSYPGALATAPPLAKSARTSAESSVASPGDVRSRPSSTSKFAGAGPSRASPLAAPAASHHPPGKGEHESAEKRARATCLT